MHIIILLFLIISHADTALAERIVLKDDTVIQGKVRSRSADTIWVDIGPGSVGHPISEISYIYNDDGTISNYSPKSKEEVIKELQTRIVDELSKLRQLPLKNKIESDEVTPEEIKNFYFSRAQDDSPKEFIMAEEKLLKKLKLVPPDFNYEQTFEQFAREDVGGFYDDRDKKLYISTAMDEEARLFIIPHEAVHALQDQNFNLAEFLPDDLSNSDLVTARVALIEGDATITSYNFMFKAMGHDIKDMPDVSNWTKEMMELALKKNPAFAKYSPFLQEQLMFPYLQGASFVHKILQNYSYEKLNEIFKDPPTSTEQILHIEKYLFQKDEPLYITIRTPAELLTKWQSFYKNVWGEYSIYSLLKQHTEILFAKVASEGWGGDYITSYENKETGKVLLVWITTWDTGNDAEEFYNAYLTTIEKRYQNSSKLDKPSSQTESVFNCGEEGLVYIGKKDKQALIIEGIESQKPDDLISAFWANIEITPTT